MLFVSPPRALRLAHTRRVESRIARHTPPSPSRTPTPSAVSHLVSPAPDHRIPAFALSTGLSSVSSIREGSTLVKSLRRSTALGTIIARFGWNSTLAAAPPAAAEYNNVGSTPLMGWSSEPRPIDPHGGQDRGLGRRVEGQRLVRGGIQLRLPRRLLGPVPRFSGPGGLRERILGHRPHEFPAELKPRERHRRGRRPRARRRPQVRPLRTPGVSHQAVVANPLIADDRACRGHRHHDFGGQPQLLQQQRRNGRHRLHQTRCPAVHRQLGRPMGVLGG